MADLAESLTRRFEVLRPHLSELQRRLWLGAEAAELGPGGVALVAQAVGVAPDTVRRGRAEAQEIDPATVVRSRRPGGGRKRAEEHDPGLVAALEALIDPVTRGDPMSPLRWTSKSTRTLARTLTEGGHKVSDFVVRRLLGELGYSLQANAKTTEGSQHPDRDAQFGYLNDQVHKHMEASNPVVSVDTKKKELVGAYKNAGREWSPAGEPEKGTSKWNKIEHRLFSHISMNWRGRPLTSHEVIVEAIAATTTSSGLKVHAELDTTHYPAGIKIPDEQMRTLETQRILTRHAFHGEWNYTFNPATPDTPEPHNVK